MGIGSGTSRASDGRLAVHGRAPVSGVTAMSAAQEALHDHRTEPQIREALREVRDPEIGKPDRGHRDARRIEVEDGLVRVHVLLTIEGCPLRDRITQDVTAAVQPLDGVERGRGVAHAR